jgi:hypothetical protein
MPDYRTMYDSQYLHEYDLPKDEVTVEILSVEVGELTSQGGRKSKKPLVKFKGADKGLALNKTNGKAIAQMYGNDTAEWTGKKVTLFRSTTEMAGETVKCIRVKKPS